MKTSKGDCACQSLLDCRAGKEASRASGGGKPGTHAWKQCSLTRGVDAAIFVHRTAGVGASMPAAVWAEAIAIQITHDFAGIPML